MKDKCTVNRAKLVDEPIVEMILSKKYSKSGIRFMKSDLKSDYDGCDIICYVNGVKKSIDVKRNSSKHYMSPNFTITIDRNNLTVFNNTSYVFIDEVADCLYIINGINLLKYIIEHKDNIHIKDDNPRKPWVLIPKSDLALLASDKNHIIKYNKRIAELFSLGRDEKKFSELV